MTKLDDHVKLDHLPAGQPRQRLVRSSLIKSIILLAAIFITLHLYTGRRQPQPYVDLQNYCTNTSPISITEFQQRQQRLNTVLVETNAVYIAEPGPSALYFANISTSHWRLSERPLLLIVTPSSSEENPKITILTPKFEATRAKLLSIPASSGVSYIEWAEDQSPYEVAAQTIGDYKTIFLDDQTRLFIADGLKKASGGEVVSAPKIIRSIRERKSPAEIALLRCANEATLLAIRAVRKQMKLGMHAKEVQLMLGDALHSAGLESSNSTGLVLFGADAALPHGSATDKTLSKHDLVLIDVGGTLHGYQSDITRTFALPDSEIPADALVVWFAVQAAQRAAHRAAQNGTIASVVDRAAREALTQRNYGDYFTHRLGHGIGLEVHESPYLRGASEDILMTGNTFSNEPGVYIEGKVGCRLEDIFVVSEDGSPEFLTSRVGGPASTPWTP